MTAQLLDAVEEWRKAKAATLAPYVPTARNAPRPELVRALRGDRLAAAERALAVAAAAEKSPRAHVTGSADGLLAHRVGPDHLQVCTGEHVPEVAVTPTADALADTRPCPDCGWELL